jgi:hypothetical protein
LLRKPSPLATATATATATAGVNGSGSGSGTGSGSGSGSGSLTLVLGGAGDGATTAVAAFARAAVAERRFECHLGATAMPQCNDAILPCHSAMLPFCHATVQCDTAIATVQCCQSAIATVTFLFF